MNYVIEGEINELKTKIDVSTAEESFIDMSYKSTIGLLDKLPNDNVIDKETLIEVNVGLESSMSLLGYKHTEIKYEFTQVATEGIMDTIEKIFEAIAKFIVKILEYIYKFIKAVFSIFKSDKKKKADSKSSIDKLDDILDTDDIKDLDIIYNTKKDDIQSLIDYFVKKDDILNNVNITAIQRTNLQPYIKRINELFEKKNKYVLLLKQPLNLLAKVYNTGNDNDTKHLYITDKNLTDIYRFVVMPVVKTIENFKKNNNIKNMENALEKLNEIKEDDIKVNDVVMVANKLEKDIRLPRMIVERLKTMEKFDIKYGNGIIIPNIDSKFISATGSQETGADNVMGIVVYLDSISFTEDTDKKIVFGVAGVRSNLIINDVKLEEPNIESLTGTTPEIKLLQYLGMRYELIDDKFTFVTTKLNNLDLDLPNDASSDKRYELVLKARDDKEINKVINKSIDEFDKATDKIEDGLEDMSKKLERLKDKVEQLVTKNDTSLNKIKAIYIRQAKVYVNIDIKYMLTIVSSAFAYKKDIDKIKVVINDILNTSTDLYLEIEKFRKKLISYVDKNKK